MNRSTFPAAIDTFVEHFDIQASDVVNVKRYQELKMKTVLSPAEQTELANLTTALVEKLFTPEDFNKLQDAITNLETFFRDNVEDYMLGKQVEYETYIDNNTTLFDSKLNRFSLRGEYNPTTQYYQWNYITYQGEGFIAKRDSLGKAPIGDGADLDWLKTGVKGVKGEAGDRGIDGVGLNFKGSYDVLVNYDADDLVTYDGSTWACIQAISGVAPSTSLPASTYWRLFVAKGGSTILARYENQVVLASPTTNVPIGISQFSSTKDALAVYQGGTKITKGIEFSINANGTSIDKINDDGSATWNAGTIIDFVVDKNVSVDGSTEIDGTNLTDGSVSLIKLSQGVIDQLGSKAPLSSPVFTDIPTAPTAPPSTNTKQIANTEFVMAEVAKAKTYAP